MAETGNLTIYIPIPLKKENRKNTENPSKPEKEIETRNKKDYVDMILNHLCALRNCGGGTLNIVNGNECKKNDKGHLSDVFLESFEEKLKLMDDELKNATNVGEEYTLEEKENGKKITITIQKGRSIATVKSNSKTALKHNLIETSKEEIVRWMNTQYQSPNPKFPSFLDKIGKLEMNQDVPIPESEVLQFKCADNQNKKEMKDCLGKHLHKYGSAFTKIEGGGSFVYGVQESKVKKEGRTKWIIKGVPLQLCQDKCGKEHCDECSIRKNCRDIVRDEMLWMSKTSDSFVEASWEVICQHYEIRFLKIKGSESHFLIEIVFSWFDGIVFYRREGPNSFEVSVDGKTIRKLTAEEWLKRIRRHAGNSAFSRHLENGTMPSAKSFWKRSQNIQTSMVTDVKSKASQSIGLICYREQVQGTCFRVGENYIMTCFHVIENIIRDTADGSRVTEDMKIVFEYKEWNPASTSVDIKKIFELEPVICYVDRIHDVVVLKIMKMERYSEYPPPLEWFADLQYDQDVHLTGHPGGRIMGEDCVRLLRRDQTLTMEIQMAQQWSLNTLSFDAYAPLLNEKLVLFQTAFTPGSAGSPGFVASNRVPYVILFLSGGVPRCYYVDPQRYRSVITDEMRIEFGFSMRDISEQMKLIHPELEKDVFRYWL